MAEFITCYTWCTGNLLKVKTLSCVLSPPCLCFILFDNTKCCPAHVFCRISLRKLAYTSHLHIYLEIVQDIFAGRKMLILPVNWKKKKAARASRCASGFFLPDPGAALAVDQACALPDCLNDVALAVTSLCYFRVKYLRAFC